MTNVAGTKSRDRESMRRVTRQGASKASKAHDENRKEVCTATHRLCGKRQRVHAKKNSSWSASSSCCCCCLEAVARDCAVVPADLAKS